MVNNVINGGLAANAIVDESNSSLVNGNQYATAYGGLAVASASSLEIPDYIELISVTGTTTITGGITTRSRATFVQKISGVTISNAGSGYTSAPTVSFSGGGGTGAAATAYIGSDGTVVGVIITNAGSGYTSAPTISFSGGGGSAAAATAIVGVDNIAGRQLMINFAGNAQLNHASNVYLAGSANFVPGTSGSSIMHLQAMYGTNWHEVSRSAV